MSTKAFLDAKATSVALDARDALDDRDARSEAVLSCIGDDAVGGRVALHQWEVGNALDAACFSIESSHSTRPSGMAWLYKSRCHPALDDTATDPIIHCHRGPAPEAVDVHASSQIPQHGFVAVHAIGSSQVDEIKQHPFVTAA